MPSISIAGHNERVTEADHPRATRTARQIARTELTRAITQRAREQLGEVGPAQLSVRAVARDLGMASSAVYRYFPSRDDLLTALLVLAYDELGEAVERAEAAVRRRQDFSARWLAFAGGFRSWSKGHPHDFALLYGSPVPGYAAPATTTGPATRVTRVLVGLLADVQAAGAAPPPHGPIPRAARRTLAGFHAYAGRAISDDLAYRGLAAWGGLVGAVTLELFGHLHGAVDDFDTSFDQLARRLDVLAGTAS